MNIYLINKDEVTSVQNVVTEIFTDESVSRTKGDIVGHSDTDFETGESTRDESSDITDRYPNVKF